MKAAAETGGRRWLAPEVVQTSAMDCGPAALKCVLEGFHIPVSYGRLREACQTDVDGTSIDTVELIAGPLGVAAEQIMIPLDHLFLPEAAALPAIVVVRHGDGATHFVVVWRQLGDWLQVMDPARGRRWVRSRRFADEVFRHELSVPGAEWRDWAASAEFLAPLRGRLALLGVGVPAAEALLGAALGDPGWFPVAALDASVRLAQTIVRARGVARGQPALRLVRSLFERSCASGEDIFAVVPQSYWSAVPDAARAQLGVAHLLLRGAVLLRIGALAAGADGAATAHAAPLSRELAAALGERPPHPLRAVWGLLRQDGLLGPLALAGAMSVAAAAVVVEALLLRGVFDIAWQLNLAHQRLLALAALTAFVALLLAIELPIVTESMRHGRHLETRLRMALLAKLPRLPDRYFQSRSVPDMADRSHSLQGVRTLPTLGMNFIQSIGELLLTLIGIALIAPASAGFALAIVLATLAVPAALQPLLGERDLRLRSHGSALNGFYLDALLGLVPLRTHHAELAVRRQHEGLLVAWARSSRGMVTASIAAGGVQALLCSGLAGWLLVEHFMRAGAVGGADLLLIYWALKLPAVGSGVGALARQYPAQRNVLLRLLEPLAAPEDEAVPAAPIAVPIAALIAAPHAAPRPQRGVAIEIDGGSVLAGGHATLRDVTLRIAAGEQVAVVGASGAGKSSLLGLLLGWHRLATGTLRVDGAALTGAAQDALRRDTAWVDPSVQLWNRSLIDNLGYASDDAALARVGEVIDAARLRGVLRKLPDGLQTRLGEGGALLSGGEGQRVRLGRAMLQPGVRLALLDEPFRGLDRHQRGALLADARRWWADATLLCVTHDVAETLSFARVLVVDAGRIVEDGAPAALAAADTRYAAMLAAERQLHAGCWQGHGGEARWRRLRVEGGRVDAAAEGGS